MLWIPITPITAVTGDITKRRPRAKKPPLISSSQSSLLHKNIYFLPFSFIYGSFPPDEAFPSHFWKSYT